MEWCLRPLIANNSSINRFNTVCPQKYEHRPEMDILFDSANCIAGYIDGSFVSRTVVGVLLACFERLSHVTHFYKDTIPMRDSLSVRLGPRITLSNILSTNGPGNFHFIYRSPYKPLKGSINVNFIYGFYGSPN